MMLSRLVFYSRTTLRIVESANMIRRLLQTCGEYSPASGLTGGIVFNEKYFMHVIEGSRDQISRQLRNIFADPRYEDVTILSVEEIVRREFDGWAVGYAGHTVDAERIYLRYSPTVDINPALISARALFEFVRDFCALDTLYVQRIALGDQRSASAPAAAPLRPAPASSAPQRPEAGTTETIKVVNVRQAG